MPLILEGSEEALVNWGSEPSCPSTPWALATGTHMDTNKIRVLVSREYGLSHWSPQESHTI